MELNIEGMNEKNKSWSFRHALFMLIGIAMAVLLNTVWLVFIPMILSMGYFFRINVYELKKFRPFGGYANWITLSRLCLVLLIGGLYPGITDNWLLAGMILVLCLDGLDGMLARKFNHQSEAGALFDMEVDAFYVTVLCLLIYGFKYIFWWIIFGAVLRYAYVILVEVAGFKIQDEPSVFWKKIFAVVFFIALLTPFAFPEKVAHMIILIALGMLVFSFGRDIYYLVRTRGVK
jgi:phosphatidylglycerophosphate synthase